MIIIVLLLTQTSVLKIQAKYHTNESDHQRRASIPNRADSLPVRRNCAAIPLLKIINSLDHFRCVNTSSGRDPSV